MNRRGGRREDGVDHSLSPAPDQGFSLVEVVVTIILMGTVLLAIMQAAISGIKSSSASNDLAKIETVLQNAADRVNRAPLSCNYDQFVKAAAQAADWDPEQASAAYQYYVPGTDATQTGTWQTGPCSTPGVAGKDVQLVTITIVSPDGKVTRSMQVVKSHV